MAVINKLFLQKDAFGKIIVGSRRLNSTADRSSCPEYSVKKMCWKFLQSSQENTCAEVFFEQSCRPEVFNFIKKKLQHRCFAVNFTKFLKTPIQLEVWERLPLDWFINAKILNGFYKLSIIFSVECRGNSPPCYLFPLHPYTLLILNSIYKDIFWLNQ